MLGSGIGRVIKIRGVTLADAAPDNVFALLERSVPSQATSTLSKQLAGAAFTAHTPKLKEIVRRVKHGLASGVSLGVLVQAIAQHEGKVATDDLKKWSKYHSDESVRATSLTTLISFGELDFVEEQLKAEQDKMITYSVGEKLNRARLGG